MRLTSHALIAVLIAAALAAPAAQAQPDRGPVKSIGSFGVSDAAQATAGDHRHQVGAGQTVTGQTGGLATKRQLPSAPAYPEHPKPIASVPTTPAVQPGDDGLPWETIAFGLAGAALALTAAGTLAGLRRRSQRPRIAA